MKTSLLACALLIAAISTHSVLADTPNVTVDGGIKITHDVFYTPDNDPSRSLDIYQPEKALDHPLPLIILIHGGGWAGGDKGGFGGQGFVHRGYAAASIDYRLSKQATWPAQAIDCKAAVRWLRAHAAQYGFDTKRFVVCGHSAGGHLVAFLAASNGVKKFDAGENLNVSSDVQASICLSGVTDLVARVLAPGFEWDQKETSDESMMLGGAVLLNKDTAMDASPVTWVSKKSAPVLFEAGTEDNLVPFAQVDEMVQVLKKAGIYSEAYIMKGVGHGGNEYLNLEHLNLIDTFLAHVLKMTPNGGNSGAVGKGSYFLIQVRAPKLVLTGDASGLADGTKVTLDTPTGGLNQKWSFVSRGAGLYTIRPVYAQDLALSVVGGAKLNQTPVILSKDTGSDAQLWSIVYSAVDDVYFLAPKCAPNSVIANFGGQQLAGEQMIIWDYNGADPNLQWRMSAAR